MEAVTRIRAEARQHFAALKNKQMAPGLLLTLRRADGSILRFEVVKRGVLARVPFGFSNFDNVVAFAGAIRDKLTAIGINDARVYVVGSAARGVAHSSKAGLAGRPYDEGRVSDVEIEIVSDTLAQRCSGEQQIRHGELAARLDLLLMNLEELSTREQMTLQNQAGEKKSLRKEIKRCAGEIKVVKRQMLRLEEANTNDRLRPNSDRVPELVDLRRNTLPKFTNRPVGPSKAVGIRVSLKENMRDIEETSILLVDQATGFLAGEPDLLPLDAQTPADIPASPLLGVPPQRFLAA